VAAQAIHNSTSIFVSNSTTIYCGDVDNNGLILNNGTIEITGNWANQQVYQGLGTIILSGANQSIDNNDQSVQDLLVIGVGTKTLTGNLMIDGSIELAAGIINVGDDDTLLVRNGAQVNGGSVVSFVEGALTVEGTGYKFFPIGRNGVYYPVSLTDIQGVDLTTHLAAFNNLPSVKTSTPVDIDPRVYWKRQTIKGGFVGSRVSAPVQLNTDDPDRIAFITGNSFQDEFGIVGSTGLQSLDGLTFAVSKDPIDKAIFAFGELPEKPAPPPYLSTTLSPNASNPDNRLIKLFSVDINSDNFHFVVVNRWGNTVFESRSLNDMSTNGWNGKSDGQLLPSGPYPYSLSYIDKTGSEQTTRGFVTILY
jgi:hypothetical protein